MKRYSALLCTLYDEKLNTTVYVQFSGVHPLFIWYIHAVLRTHVFSNVDVVQSTVYIHYSAYSWGVTAGVPTGYG